MGGIVTTGIGIQCDRCQKTVSVNDAELAQFYIKFSEREDQDELMFASLYNSNEGESLDVTFEYLCPKCSKAVKGYMESIAMVKKAAVEEPVEEPKPKKKAAKKKAAKKKAVEEPVVEEDDDDDGPIHIIHDVEATVGEDFDSDELFD